jgi:hypothetical protein
MAMKRHACPFEFMAETRFINGFKQAGTEVTVHAHRQADDPVRNIAAVSEAGLHGCQIASGGLMKR